MQTLDVLDWMLEEAKKRPVKIHHDFVTRFRVWKEEIIPSRISAIRQCGGDADYVSRMIELTVADADRLLERLYYEGEELVSPEVAAHPPISAEDVHDTLATATEACTREVKQ